MTEKLKSELTKDNIASATRTVQAIEALAEDFYHEIMLKQLGKDAPSEEEVAETADEMNQHLPMQTIITSGHGYRTTVTLMANMLSQIGQTDLSNAVQLAVIDEME